MTPQLSPCQLSWSNWRPQLRPLRLAVAAGLLQQRLHIGAAATASLLPVLLSPCRDKIIKATSITAEAAKKPVTPPRREKQDHQLLQSDTMLLDMILSGCSYTLSKYSLCLLSSQCHAPHQPVYGFMQCCSVFDQLASLRQVPCSMLGSLQVQKL